ncbi:MAG: hypothetical protein JXR30_04020, partial [Alphaproteobacteria bacterium]|nr:hypothetical protein [Alphaproteobacteria bacterium]
YWYYQNQKIAFYRKETKTFTLYSLPTDTAYSANIGKGEDETLSIQTSAVLKEWDEIEQALKGIIQDGELSVSRSTGTITVTAGPSTLQRVGKYVREQNRRLSKMVAINVRVLQVSIEDENAVGLNLGAVFQDSGLSITKNAFSPLSSLDSVQGMTVAVADDPGGSLAGAAGSTGVVNALAKQGKVSLVTSSVVTTRNNRIAPVNNTQTFKYVDSFSTSAQSDTFNTTDFKPEEETVGFSMQLLPNILENGRLLLMFKMSLKELLGWDTQTFGGGTTADGATSDGVVVKMPKIENRSFSQELVLKSGQTLIMTGFEKMRNNDSRQGVGDPNFMGLGGERITGSTRDVLVVIMTPQILQSPLDPEERLSDQWGTPAF